MLIPSYIMSNFEYCSLVWMFSSERSLNEIENLQKRALRFLYNDYNSSYEVLIEKAGKVSMNVCRLRTLCIEIYKTLNEINPSFMKDVFKLRESNRLARDQYKMNLNISKYNQVNFGKKA